MPVFLHGSPFQASKTSEVLCQGGIRYFSSLNGAQATYMVPLGPDCLGSIVLPQFIQG
jgi:hypothetical protein